jgi:calcium-dependent protein kinase
MEETILRTASANKSMFVNLSPNDIKSRYDLREKIDQGASGQVYKAYLKIHNSDETTDTQPSDSTDDFKNLRAIKRIEKRIIKDPVKLRNEIEILQLTDYPYIVRLFEYYEGPKDWYLVMEFCTGGNLIEYLKHKKTLNEKTASLIFKQLILSLKYLHDHKIVHRDLKPHNLLLQSPDDLTLKLIDFGLSKLCKTPNIKMKTRTGSPDYAAPEVRSNVEYSSSCDIWSCGCILFFLLSGKTPFHDKSQAKSLEKMKNCSFNFDDPIWSNVSDLVKDLISRMIVLDPGQRLNVDQILQHPWLAFTEINPETEICLDLDSIINYCDSVKLRKFFLLCMASKCTDEDIKSLRQTFISLDTDNNGSLSFGEIENALKYMKDMDVDILEIIRELDCDRSGAIDYTEFIASSLDSCILLNTERLLEAFKVFDTNCDDRISAEELRNVLVNEGTCLDLAMCESLLVQCDANGDGAINYNEFVELVEEGWLNRFDY